MSHGKSHDAHALAAVGFVLLIVAFALLKLVQFFKRIAC